MKYCTKCGAEMNDEQRFCVQCGEKAKQGQSQQGTTNSPSISEEVHTEQKSKDQSTNKRPLSKKNKALLFSGLAFILLLFVSHQLLNAYFDPVKELEAMDIAIAEGDADAFVKHIEFDQDALFNPKAYFDYIQEEEWDQGVKEQLLQMMLNDKEQAHGLMKNIESVSGEVLYKVKSKKKFGLYPAYQLSAVPLEIGISTNLDGAKVWIADKEFELPEAETITSIDSIHPGSYSVEASAKGEFGDFEQKGTYEVSPYDRELYIDFDYYSVDVPSSYRYEDALIYIDGKKTDDKLNDIQSIGPLPKDVDMTLFAVWNNGGDDAVISNVEHINEKDYPSSIRFDFNESDLFAADLLKEASTVIEAGRFVLDFRSAYENAVNYADFQEIERYLKKDSHAYKDLQDFINDMDDGYYYYDFESNKVLGIKQEDDHHFKVHMNEQFRFIDDENNEYDYNREKTYQLEEKDGEYQIEKIDYTDTKKNKK